MEKTKEYSEAVSEALEILQMSSEEVINKIPLEVIQQMNKNKSKTYKSKFDVTKPINESDLSEKAKAILAFLYRDYICPEEERAEINKILYENEQQEAEEELEKKEEKLSEAETEVNEDAKEETKEDKDLNNNEEVETKTDSKSEEEIKIEESKEFVNVLPATPKKKNFFKRMIESFFFYDDEI